MSRPKGVESPPSREFVIGNPALETVGRRERFYDWSYHVWSFRIRRGGKIELDLDDKTLNWLQEIGWIHQVKKEWFMTRKGSHEFNQFLREERDRIGQRKRKED